MHAFVAVIPKRMCNDIFLRLGQTGKRYRGRSAAPENIGVGVIGDHTLDKTRYQLLAWHSVVIEELGQIACSLTGRDGVLHHRLLTSGQVFVLCLQRGAQFANHQLLLIK